MNPSCLRVVMRSLKGMCLSLWVINKRLWQVRQKRRNSHDFDRVLNLKDKPNKRNGRKKPYGRSDK